MSGLSPCFEREIRNGPKHDVLFIWYSGGCVKRDVKRPHTPAEIDAAWADLQPIAEHAWRKRAAKVIANVRKHFEMMWWNHV